MGQASPFLKILLVLQEKIAMLRENESLLKANERLNHEKESLLKTKEISDGQISALTKSLEALHRDLKDKENLVVCSYQTAFCIPVAILMLINMNIYTDNHVFSDTGLEEDYGTPKKGT